MTIDLSCPDWEQRLRDGRPLVPDLPLDNARAARTEAVFKRLRLADVPHNPTMAEAGGEWFFAVVRALFGAFQPNTSDRFVRELLLLVPKKNSKTSNGALLMLTALLLNLRPRAKFIMTGPTQDVAELAFAQAKGAIELDPVLSAKLHIRDHLKTIQHRVSGAELEIMTFDPNVLTGQKPAGVLVDELHVSAKMAKAASAIRQLRGGMLAVPEAFLAFITTQSEEAPAGPFRQELIEAREIRDGRRKGSMLPVLYEFPERMQKDAAQWRDPANWSMVTPNAGRSIEISRLEQEFLKAEEKGQEELRAWASQHLNVEIGLALHTDRWAGVDAWEKQEDASITLDMIIATSDAVTVGVDEGGTDDLLGLAVTGRCRATGIWRIWARGWADPLVLERRKSEASRLLDFAEQGDLRIVPGGDTRVGEVVDIIERIWAAGVLAGVGLDGQGPGLVPAKLVERGITGEVETATAGRVPLAEAVPQGWRMSGAIKRLELALTDGECVHAAQPLMTWCVGNARAEPRGNAVAITKQAAGTAKIDLLVAAFMAVALMSRNPQPAGFQYTGI